MAVTFSNSIELIPIDKIQVLNPRDRGRTKFQQIAANIGDIGLKKPVTVSVSNTDSTDQHYILVCGQGRLEAYRFLGQTEIPCIIATGSKEELLLMSLTENLARRQHTCMDMVKQLGLMKDQGYSAAEIAKKIGMDVTYVRGLLKLLDKGEEKLLQAVEKGTLPISVAVIIASSDDKAVQDALREAYDNNDLRGEALARAKRIIEQRKSKGKGVHGGRDKPNPRSVSTKVLIQRYQNELNRQQALIKKSKAFESRLLMAISAFNQLYQNEDFRSLLKSESLNTLPQFLAERIKVEPAT